MGIGMGVFALGLFFDGVGAGVGSE
jgi:hypothetical protein